jgi:hypothetical protein
MIYPDGEAIREHGAGYDIRKRLVAGRNAGQRRPQLQCQSEHDFAADGVTSKCLHSLLWKNSPRPRNTLSQQSALLAQCWQHSPQLLRS